MPVAHKQPTILEESQFGPFGGGGDQLPTTVPPRRLDAALFDEIKELLDKSKAFHSEEKNDRKKAEKLSQSITAAQQMIVKAEEKLEALLKKNKTLQDALDNMNNRTSQALEYWQDYGLDVRQVSSETDPFDQYEFIFSKLTRSSGQQQQQQQQEPSDTKDDKNGPKYSIGVRFQDKQLRVVSQNPETMTPEQINELNENLTTSCVADCGQVDYKLAMLKIRKILIKNLGSSSSKTC